MTPTSRLAREPAGSGTVGSGIGVCDLWPTHADAASKNRAFKYLRFKRLLTLPISSVGGSGRQSKSPVHHDGLSGDVPCRFTAEEGNDVRHVLGLRHPPQDRLMFGPLEHLARQFGEQLRLYEAGRDGVDVDVGRPE